MTADRLRELADAAPSGPWSVTGGYPQRVTNGTATLIAEIFDEPDSPPATAPLIALTPELARWAADAAEAMAQSGGITFSQQLVLLARLPGGEGE